MKEKSKYWSVSELGRLMELDRQGASMSDIADTLGRTRNSIIGKLDRIRGREAKPKKCNFQKRAESLVRPVLTPVEAPEGFKTLLDVGPGECRWPSEESAHICCSKPVVKGVYCGTHRALAYVGTKRPPGGL